MWNMKAFYLRFYQSDTKLLQVVALLPWGHILYLMNKFQDNDEAMLYYAEETVAKGWSRDMLTNAVKLQMFEYKTLENQQYNNFNETLPSAQATFAHEVMKDTYNLGFLSVTEPILELDLERRLVEKIKLFLLELGKGLHTLVINIR